MNIIKASTENPVTLYELLEDGHTEKMRDHAGDTLKLKEYIVLERENIRTGEMRRVCIIMAEDGTRYATNSVVFIENFLFMLEMFERGNVPLKAIDVTTGASRTGRTFVNCRYHRDF